LSYQLVSLREASKIKRFKRQKWLQILLQLGPKKTIFSLMKSQYDENSDGAKSFGIKSCEDSNK